MNESSKSFKKWLKKTKPIWLWFIPNIKTILLVYVLGMALLLRKPIDSYLTTHIGEQLTFFYRLMSSDTLVNLLTTVLVIAFGTFIITRVVKEKNYTWLSFFTLFLAIYLLIDNHWQWAETVVCIDYRFLFIIILLAIFVIGCYKLVKQAFKSPQKSNTENDVTGFSVTTEKEQMQDTGWEQYAENLKAKILKTDMTKESFAVGVSGIWGSGKTTFLNEMEEKLKKEVYLIEFNPWNSDSATQISNDFFQTLISKLSISSYQKHTILKYAKLLGQINALGTQAKITTTIFDTIDGPINDAKEKAAGVIVSMPLPVVVFIDDLDRLDSSELLAVLRLVRVTANFKNLVFVVAYDKEYVTQALGRAGIQNGEQFLKKIFPLEVCLPSFESYVMANHLYSELKAGLNNADLLKQLEYPVFRTVVNRSIAFYLPTFRDVKRFTNQFCLNLNSFVQSQQISEIDVIDFFYLELLHYYDFEAYQFIERNPTEILTYGLNADKKYAYSYSTPGSIKGIKNIEEKDANRVQVLSRLKEGVPDLLWMLFGRTCAKENTLLRYPTNFSKYFSYRINKDMISLAEFEKFLSSETQQELDEKIKEYCRGNISKRVSLKYHLNAHTLDASNEKQVFNVAYTLLALSLMGTVVAGPAFREVFNKSRYNDNADVVARALIKAIEAYIGREQSWTIIQDILTSLVEFVIIAPSDDESHVEYESVLTWDQLKELAEKNFEPALAGRNISIQQVTNDNTLFHGFLKRAVAERSIQYIDGENDDRTSQSLLLETLTKYYSSKDNSKGLTAFFENLDPIKDDQDDYFFSSELDEYHNWVNKNIAKVFGSTYNDKDFYTFISAAFKDDLERVNKYLKRFDKTEIEVQKDVNEPAEMVVEKSDDEKYCL